MTIWSIGSGVLDVLGIDMRGVGQRIDRLEQRHADGSLMSATDVAKVSARFGHPTVTVPRRRLVARLANGVPASTVNYGKGCTVAPWPRRPTAACLADGSHEDGELLIGADGEHSTVRASLVDADPATPNGWDVWQGLSPVPWL